MAYGNSAIFFGQLLLAVASASTVQTTVLVNTSRVLSATSSISFGCVGIDWWPRTKCDYGRCSWDEASMLNLDLENVKLQNAVQALTPVFVRLGGSLADFVRYEELEGVKGQETKCVPFSAPTNNTRIGYELGTGCLKMGRWEELNKFCSKASNCHLLFDLNALIGRQNGTCPQGTNCHIQDASRKHPCCTNWTGSWNPGNAESLLRYTKAHFGDNVYAFEFGNELVGPAGIEATLTVEQYVDDFCRLYDLVNDIWSDDPTSKPKLVAPDTAFEEDWYGAFIKMTGERSCYPDIVTWHQYLLGAGVDPKVEQRAMDPNVLNKQVKAGQMVNVTIQSNLVDSSHMPEIWMGEAGGAYNSGRHLVTDAFMSSFWYLDGFGILSENNHQTFCRQTLIGGNYGLLNTTTYEPNPDYYALLLWQRLMGSNVFNVQVHSDQEQGGLLRAYAHCSNSAKDPGLTILLINLSNETEFLVNVTEYWYRKRTEYVMTSTSLHSQTVFLNGAALKTSANGDIPELIGKVVDPSNEQGTEEREITLKPHTYGFFTFVAPDAQHCR